MISDIGCADLNDFEDILETYFIFYKPVRAPNIMLLQTQNFTKFS